MPVTMYCIQGVGNDLNSGSTTGSVPKVSGTGAATSVGATVDLSADSPDLSTVVSGDTIRLNGRTDGRHINNPGDIFEITAVNDGADTVDVIPDTDSVTSGVTWAIGGAFITIKRLIDVADQNDVLYAKGTFNESVDMVNSTPQGSATGAISLIGYSTTPGDSGLVILDSNYTKTNAFVLRNGNNYWAFENIRITRFNGQGFRDAFLTTPVIFIHCEVDNCNGLYAFGTAKHSIVIDCYSHDNAGNGFSHTEGCYFLNCVSVSNSGNGFYAQGANDYVGCISVGNALDGFHQNSVSNLKGLVILNCLVDGSGVTEKGIYFLDQTTQRQPIIQNTIVYDCDSGIVGNTSVGKFALGENNLVADCPVPYVNFIERHGSVSGTPTFLDRANLDYRPADGAPQIGAGDDLNESSWVPLP